MTMRTIHYFLKPLRVLGATVVIGWSSSVALAQQPNYQLLGDGLVAFQVRPNFYVLTGAGANIALQVGTDGAVVVDAGDAEHADRVVAAIKKLTDAPIRFLINTGDDPDHVGGNAKVAGSGKTIFAGEDPFGVGKAMGVSRGAVIAAAEPVLLRMSASGTYPSGSVPTDPFAQRRWYIYLNGEGIEAMRQENAHTDGDSIVFFRRSDVVMAGDIIDMRRFPVIDLDRGGSIRGEIAALNRLVDLAIPSVPIVSRDAGTVVVPGHGRLLDLTDVVEYRDMVTIVRDRIQALMKQGKSLKEIKAAKPTQGFTSRYGSDTGPWTTDMFVEAVFKSLAADAPRRR